MATLPAARLASRVAAALLPPRRRALLAARTPADALGLLRALARRARRRRRRWPRRRRRRPRRHGAASAVSEDLFTPGAFAAGLFRVGRLALEARLAAEFGPGPGWAGRRPPHIVLHRWGGALAGGAAGLPAGRPW